MVISLYTTNSSNMLLEKELTNKIDYDIKFKDRASIINPTIILKSDDYINSNYCFIPSFNRYYYIENVEVFPNDIYNISLQCDVLMSFKDDIKNSYAFISQSTNDNKYYNSDYQSEVKKEVDIFESDITIDEEHTTILCTIGGV